MIASIPIGRYIDTGSLVHSLDARTKIACLVLAVAACISVNSAVSFGAMALTLLAAVSLSRLRLKVALGSLRLLLVLFGASVLLNFLFWQPAAEPRLFALPRPHIEGLIRGALVGARLILMVSFVNLFLLSTTPGECGDGVSYFLTPLRVLGKGYRNVALVFMIALRFVPLMFTEGRRILMAQRARGMETRGVLTARVKDLAALVVPMFRGVLRRADELSVALDMRCYDCARPGRSAFASKFGWTDAVAIFAVACVFVLVRFVF
ncbi:MAG: energy-coupling factor transporter transmembrane component T [Candidatus Eisenbacteria bacterium]